MPKRQQKIVILFAEEILGRQNVLQYENELHSEPAEHVTIEKRQICYLQHTRGSHAAETTAPRLCAILEYAHAHTFGSFSER
eukprot:1724749-Prymnesium_polylepis.1